MKQSVAGADEMMGKFAQLSVSAKKSAEAQVQASVKKDARLREEILAYKAVAAAAARGSREQVAAANLAAKAQHRLSQSLSVTAHESRHLASASKSVERDFMSLGRGAAFGSGAFHGLGRSMLYASSFLIGGAGITQLLKGSVEAATRSRATMGQLATAVNNAGVGWKNYRSQIDESLKSSERLGFTQQQSAQSFASLVRATHDAAKASRDLRLAEDINRGTSGRVSLAAATKAVTMAEAGRATGLTRLGIAIHKGASAQEALRLATIAYGGSAVKWSKSAAGEQARLSVAIEQTKVAIGTALLPTVTALATKLADWLSQSRNQARIQRDVKDAVHDVSVAVGVLKDAFHVALPVVKGVSHVLGGMKKTLEDIAIAMAALKFTRIIGGFAGLGGKALIAEGEVTGLRAALLGLGSPEVLIALAAAAGAIGGIKIADLVSGPKKVAAARAGITKDYGSQIRAGMSLSQVDEKVANLRSLGLTSDPIFGAFTQIRAALLAQHSATATLSKGQAARFAAAYEKQRAFSNPGSSLTGGGPGATDAASSGGFSASKPFVPPAFTAAQKLSLALHANPNDMAALNQKATDDRNAIKFYKRQLDAQKIDNATYVKLTNQANDDLTSTLSQITSIEQSGASKAKSEADKQKAARTKAAKAAMAHVQAGQFDALGLGPKGTGQSPLKETLGHELSRVKAQLKGTLLDSDKNTHLLSQVARVLDGQFGALTDKTRAAVRKLLDTLSGELKKGKKGFGPTGRVVTAEDLTKGIAFASVEAKKAQQARIAQLIAHGGHVPSAIGVQGIPIVIHTKVHLDKHVVGQSVTTHQQKAGRYRSTQTSGIHAGRGPV